ncbi:MAG: Segregation and condensation protein B [Calditrichaeota bacterium]|nr:Segregation and condensation protein B [Calditrichota bacterium]
MSEAAEKPTNEHPAPPDAPPAPAEFAAHVEALLFAAEEPLREEDVAAAIPGLLEAGVAQAMDALEQTYRANGHALTVQRVAGGWRLATRAEFAELVRGHLKGRIRGRLSRASLETVSIIAYKQPVSRAEIEQMRGVDTSQVLRHLLERGLINTAGRAEAPGRPLLYETTPAFLTYFGLDSLADLPDPGEVLEEPDERERGSVIDVQRGPFADIDPGLDDEN